ncbi:flagellar export chaperone FlgN [Ammoniphilus sp. CFH 90114]|uniref:flagellar export chaperone FlgN n=1 Tax=Ammoniphilus sp. CFH 90114 TaxID=2493665 RepID=UPI00100DEE95|nr:flagellar export chaperone FlgN [Ammoniphilus sp. CFH 90114]RXT04478.1 hypothetical protein EIZ39_19855 [Ammoniphilus sp. CFH 90114]
MSTLPLLRSCLERLLEEHKELLELAEEKKQVLINGSLNELQIIVAKESQRVNKIKDYDEERQRLVQEFLILKGIRRQDHSLRDCIPLMESQEEQRMFSQLRNELRELLLRLNRINGLNQQLLEQSMSFVQYTLEVLTEDNAPTVTYGNPLNQATAKRSGKGFFDSKV